MVRWRILGGILLAMLITVLAPPVTALPEDARELEAFIDGVMAAQFRAYDLVGGVVAVVRNGELYFSKGYGYADRESRTPVDPDRSLFRIGSATKLFTWTAVMQLVEEGKLDLDADVSDYLTAFTVPATFAEPVTMSNLMGHTAGFEDRLIGLFARGPEELRPLGELLAQELPDRVRPPGQLAAYSNHGVGLAGHVVEELTGLAWNNYLDERILGLLGMTRTSGRQPLPPELDRDLAVGYVPDGDALQPGVFEFIPLEPAGSMSATANDMARFMIAHLNEGAYGDVAILQPDTAEQMHRTHFTADPRLGGMAHGFIEQHAYGERIIGHSGGTVSFHTDLILLPEHDVGLFVSFNSPDGIQARLDFVDVFLRRYFGVVPAEDPLPAAEAETYARQVSGSYRPTRAAHSTFDKLFALFQEITVTPADQGRLIVRGLGMEPIQFAPVEALVFDQVDGHQRLLFQEDEEGRVVHGSAGNALMAYERLSWHQSSRFHFTVIAASAFLFISALIGWPLAALRHRGRGPGVLPRLARLSAWSAGGLFMGFLVGTAFVLSDPFEIMFGIPSLVPGLLVMAMAGSALVLISLALAVFAWARGYWSLAGRIHYSLVVLAGLAFVWFLGYWNLLGFRF